MRAVPALPILSTVLCFGLSGAADHLREAKITAPPTAGNLAPRQIDQCRRSYTPCSDGHGCCRDGIPCTTFNGDKLGCAVPCVGDIVHCSDGSCCERPASCSKSAGQYFCASSDFPAFTGLQPTIDLFPQPTTTENMPFPSSFGGDDGSISGAAACPSSNELWCPTSTETEEPRNPFPSAANSSLVATDSGKLAGYWDSNVY